MTTTVDAAFQGREKELRPLPGKTLLTEQEASNYLREVHAARAAPATLKKWRSEGDGPLFRRRGRAIFYHRADLDTWAETTLSGPFTSTSEE